MKDKVILHLANDFSGSQVYMNLFKEIDELGVSQIIYNAIRKGVEKGKNYIDLNSPNSKIIYSGILNYVADRLFFKKKIKKIFNDVIEKVDVSAVQYVHAHTWYSDGGVAYLLFKKYNLPYVITVRSTDVLVFHKYLLHNRELGKKIIQNASKIIFVTPAYQKKVFRLWPNDNVLLLSKQKTEILPNGIDKYWLDNAALPAPIENKKTVKNINILCISSFIKRKNITLLQDAVISLSTEVSIPIKLHIVGGGGDDRNERKIKDKINAHPDLFTFHGKIKDKCKLMLLYRNSDIFALPSRRETFGLVYIEALTQGLPVLYTNEDGIDGLFNEKIGEKIFKFTNEELKSKLKIMINHLDKYTPPINTIIEDLNWSSIANKYYLLIYKYMSNSNVHNI